MFDFMEKDKVLSAGNEPGGRVCSTPAHALPSVGRRPARWTR
ncbi:hypothetical protein [Tessaracoccus coleopterorum]|nr:hypothetical protein [Tessaracoccus coleopterorum]